MSNKAMLSKTDVEVAPEAVLNTYVAVMKEPFIGGGRYFVTSIN